MRENTPFLQVNQFGNVDLSDGSLRLRAFTGHEQLSRLSHFHLEMDFPREKGGQLTADAVLGRRVVFSVNHPSVSYFSGIISSFSLGHIDRHGRRSCTADVVPELWKLTQMLDTRRFPSETVAKLAEQVVKDTSLDLRLVDKTSTDGSSHPPRSNPVQYDETLYQFLSRHLDEESIFYYFRNDYSASGGAPQGTQEWVLGDNVSDYYELVVDTSDHGKVSLTLQFQPTANVYSENYVTDWERRFNFRPASWTINDYDYHKPHDFNMTKSSNDTPNGGQYRKFKRSAGFYSKDYGDCLLDNMMKKEDVAREYIHARSHCQHLFPGAKFTLAGHAADVENGKYVVTSISHRAVEFDSQDREGEYENTFTCVPANKVVVSCPDPRPEAPSASFHLSGSVGSAQLDSPVMASARTSGGAAPSLGNATDSLARKVVAETAFVCNRTGDYKGDDVGTVVTDREGYERVLLRFPWESETEWKAAHSDKGTEANWRWVRTVQMSAGKHWGVKFLPRVGEEVVVLYIDGETKKPMVVGSVYNDDFNHQDDSANEMAMVNVEENYNGGGWDGKFPRISVFQVATSPGTHSLANGRKKKGDQWDDWVCPKLGENDVSGIRTRSNEAKVQDAKNGNQILFKDTAGKEELFVHAEKDLNLHVNGDMNVAIGGDKKEYIAGDYYRVVQCSKSSSDPARGPVNRSVSEALTFDLDATWGYTTFEWGSTEGGTHPVKVISEEYLDTRSRYHGHTMSEYHGLTEGFYIGNTLEIYVGVQEEITLALQLEATLAAKITLSKVVDIYTTDTDIEKANARIDNAVAAIEKNASKIEKNDAYLRKDLLSIKDIQSSLQKVKSDLKKCEVGIHDHKLRISKAGVALRKAGVTVYI